MLEPEWLDVLPPHDPRARRARADLRRVNLFMGNARRVARGIEGATTIADLGAGDGAFMRRVAPPGAQVVLVDRAGIAVDWDAVVVSAEAHDFLARPGPRFDAIVANLFLHHLDEPALRRLLALAARRTGLFVACEPHRSRLALHACRLLGLIGCNDVTRHDAAASVRAGFAGRELSALWPDEAGWQLDERPAAPFSHLFVARRDALP